ncbi:MFS transporter [Patescibacteria group bacterium]
MNFALSAVMIFEPVYLFTLGYSLSQVMFFYLAVYVIYVFIAPLAIRILSRLGVEHSIFYSQFFLIGYFLILYGVQNTPSLIFIAPILLALQKLFYWPAFHVDFITFSDKGQRGREISSVMAVSSIVAILGPLAGGLLVAQFGFPALFIVISVLLLFSAFPLLAIKEIHTTERESYGNVVNHIKDSDHRRSLLSFLGFGEELIVLVAWPIFIYILITDFTAMGALIAASTLFSTFILLLIGRRTDTHSGKKLARWGIVGYVITWIVRAAAKSGGFVLILDSVSQLTKNMLFVPLTTSMYERASKKNPVSYAIFFEQALSLGKIAAAIGAIILISIFSEPWYPIFILSALFSLLYLFKKYARSETKS